LPSVQVTTSSNPTPAQLQKRIDKAHAGIRRNLRRCSEQVARSMEVTSDFYAPRKTGGYSSRMKFKKSYPTEMMYEVKLYADADLSKLLRFGGLKWYDIVPREALALHFYWAKMNRWVTQYHVYRQPMRADDWVVKVADAMKGFGMSYYKTLVMEYIETISGRKPA
jgi:hypothetical protein